MKHFLILCLILAGEFARAQAVSTSAGATTAVATAPPNQSADEKAVAATERRRFDAQMRKDYTALEQILANDLVYSHSNGNVDTKQSYIQSIRDGKSKYDAIEIQEQQIRVYGNTAVVNGVCLMKASSNGEAINTRIRYTDMYVKNGQQWQMVAWQSLRLGN